MLATPNTFTANTRSHSSGLDVTTSPTAPTPALFAQHVDAIVLGQHALDRRQAITGLRYVDTLEEIETDHRVARGTEAVDDGRSDPAARSRHHHNALRHQAWLLRFAVRRFAASARRAF